MIVGMTKLISQMHFLSIWPPCLFSYEPDAWDICEQQEHVKSTLAQESNNL